MFARLYRLQYKLNQYICRHYWRPITVSITNPYNRDGKLITAYSCCNKCGIGKQRVHFITRKSLISKDIGSKYIDRFCWAIAGALAREVYGKKLTNFQLGWID